MKFQLRLSFSVSQSGKNPSSGYSPAQGRREGLHGLMAQTANYFHESPGATARLQTFCQKLVCSC